VRILIDTREQLPFSFEAYPGATTESAALPCGDYSLPGFEDRVAVERKSIDDLIGCLMNDNRARFERELARARHYELFAVVVEATLGDMAAGRYRSEMRPKSALQSVLTFFVRYGVPFIWAGNRAGAEYVTHSLLSKYLRELEERFKQATKAQQKEKADG
jgi:DNA excision repair protein ERCC-4